MSSGTKRVANVLPDEAYAMTLDEVAAVMGVSRARVWQLERRALEKLANHQETAKFADLVIARAQLRKERTVE